MNYNHKADQEDLKSRDEELYNIVLAVIYTRDAMESELIMAEHAVTETEKNLYDCIERWRNRFDAVLDQDETAFNTVDAMMDSPEVKSWLA